MGCREILKKDILVNTYITSSTISLEHSLAPCLPSVSFQGGKCPLTERTLARRPSYATEFSEGISEGIYKQTTELKLDLQSSKLVARPFNRHTSQHALVQLTESLAANKRKSKSEIKVKDGVGQGQKQLPAGLSVQHLTMHPSIILGLLHSKLCSSRYNCRLLPCQGCRRQMLQHRKSL